MTSNAPVGQVGWSPAYEGEPENPALAAMEAYRRAHPHRSDALDEAVESYDPDAQDSAPGSHGSGAEQLHMEDGMRPITWEEFFTAEEAEVTKRVRRGQQQLGPLARRWIAERVGGTIGDGGRSAKQFVNTPRGKYRISLSVDGDNTTETAAHERMGVTTVRVEAVEEMVAFFEEHRLNGVHAYEELREFLRTRLR